MTEPGRPRGPGDVGALGIILGVWAHPQDEALVSAGLMRLARIAGNRVVVVTATRGEQGAVQLARWPSQRLARLRADELAASLALLGVTEHRWLSHPDGHCAEVSERVGADRVAHIIDDVRPDTIVTFGPDGMFDDSDHRAVSAWVTTAWSATGRRPALLYAVSGSARSSLDLPLDADLLRYKAAALRAYSSQRCGLHRDEPCEQLAPPYRLAEAFASAT
jgi:LmbE family N-acetylglucosaminyl deacetylase